MAAGQPTGVKRRDALVSLYENYWSPLYAYVPCRAYAAEEAHDLSQEFFVRILSGPVSQPHRSGKGMRSFLLTSFKFFLVDEGDRSRALKRRDRVLPLEVSSGEERYQRKACPQRDSALKQPMSG